MFLCLVIQSKRIIFEPLTVQKKSRFLTMATKRTITITSPEIEQVFIKIRSDRFSNLKEIAGLLGLTLEEALNMDKQLKTEVSINRELNQLKQILGNGTN